MARRRGPNRPDLTEFELIQTEAEFHVASFERRYGVPFTPPIPVDLMVRAEFGLRCEFCRLGHAGSGEQGALCVDERLVLVDTRCTRHQFRFTVAHEGGHWVLHEGNAAMTVPVDDLRKVPIAHLLRSKSARTKKEAAILREVEANRFAAAVLMPRLLLLREAEEHSVIDQAAVVQLAKVFDVSMSAMLWRIKELSQHLDWTGPSIQWDGLRRFGSTLDVTGSGRSQTAASAASESLSSCLSKCDIGGQGQRGPRLQSPRVSTVLQAFHYLGRLSGGESADNLSGRGDGASSGVGTPRSHHGDITGWPGDNGEDLAGLLADHLRKLKSGRQPEESEEGGTTPVIIEFAGTPNSGKDTLIQIIKDYLEDGHGYRVRVFDEAIKFCHVEKGLRVDRLFKTVAQTVAQLYEARFENPGDYDFVIFNRGLLDRLAFLRVMRVLGEISEDKERVHADYLVSYAGLEDIAFLFLISEEESIRREEAKVRNSVKELCAQRDGKSTDDLRAQSIVDTTNLRYLNESYLEVFRCHKEAFNHGVYLFDFTAGSDASVMEKARALADATLPRDSSQLLLPELFGIYYACRVSSNDEKPAGRRGCKRKSSVEAEQSSLFPTPPSHRARVREPSETRHSALRAL